MPPGEFKQKAMWEKIQFFASLDKYGMHNLNLMMKEQHLYQTEGQYTKELEGTLCNH